MALSKRMEMRLRGGSGGNGPPGPPGPQGSPGASLVATANITETSLITLGLSVRRVNVNVTGVTVGTPYLMVPNTTVPVGYEIGSCYCNTNGVLTCNVLVPLLTVATTYSIPIRVLKINI